MKFRQKIYIPIKRTIDVIGSIIGILLCLLFVWWWVFIINLFVTRGHPFFCQYRYGKNRVIFKMYKFRSMRIDADSYCAPANMSQEFQGSLNTKFGKFLRTTSLDETPQLLNILFGQMSFIGPRPGSSFNEEDLVESRLQYSPNAFEVKPGLSGFAQIKMKRGHSPELKAYYDSEYIKKMGLFFDFFIFLSTIFGVFKSNKGR